MLGIENTLGRGTYLVDNRVVDAGVVAGAASLLADGVDLIEDDDVQVAVLTVLGLVRFRLWHSPSWHRQARTSPHRR